MLDYNYKGFTYCLQIVILNIIPVKIINAPTTFQIQLEQPKL